MHAVGRRTYTQNKEALQTFIAPLEEAQPREAAVCLSSHCSALSCQLDLLSALPSLHLNASYVQRRIIQCAPTSSSKGPHLTAPGYLLNIQSTGDKFQAVQSPSFNAHFSFDACDAEETSRDQYGGFRLGFGTRLPSFSLFGCATSAFSVLLPHSCREGQTSCCSRRTVLRCSPASYAGANEAAARPRRRATL